MYEKFSVAICMCLQDEGTFQLKASARAMLSRLGSRHASELSWRGMWAMVAVKGGRGGSQPLAEARSASKDFSSWGAPVLIKVDIPLATAQGNLLETLSFV